MYSSNASESQADDNTDEPLVMRRSSSLDENLDGQQLAETVGRILLHSTTNARFELNAFPSGTSRFQISVFRWRRSHLFLHFLCIVWCLRRSCWCQAACARASRLSGSSPQGAEVHCRL